MLFTKAFEEMKGNSCRDSKIVKDVINSAIETGIIDTMKSFFEKGEDSEMILGEWDVYANDYCVTAIYGDTSSSNHEFFVPVICWAPNEEVRIDAFCREARYQTVYIDDNPSEWEWL